MHRSILAFVAMGAAVALCYGCDKGESLSGDGKLSAKAESRDYAAMDVVSFLKATLTLDVSGKMQKSFDAMGGVEALAKSGKVTPELREKMTGLLVLRDVVCDAGVQQKTFGEFMEKSDRDIQRVENLSAKVKAAKDGFPAILEGSRRLGKEVYGDALDPSGERADLISITIFVAYCDASPEEQAKGFASIEKPLKTLLSIDKSELKRKLKKAKSKQSN